MATWDKTNELYFFYILQSDIKTFHTNQYNGLVEGMSRHYRLLYIFV